MIPHVDTFFQAELLRDGGSLCASFLDPHGHSVWLLLKVQRESQTSGQSVRTGFHRPLVINRTIGIENGVSWSTAKVLIARLLAHLGCPRVSLDN